MESLYVFSTPLSECSYLPNRESSLTYEFVGSLTAAEYEVRLKDGWRRFGFSLFRPTCPTCRACQSLRVPVPTFKPDRSQRRALAANDNEVSLVIGIPEVSEEKLDLYDRFHHFQYSNVGWSDRGPKCADDYVESFVDNPFVTQEWRYYLGKRLIGVGYVDRVPEGLSAIYFFHEPDERARSLGTYNVLSVLRAATAWNLPHVYLGYYVEGCRSLEYKARFRPNQVLGEDGEWKAFG